MALKVKMKQLMSIKRKQNQKGQKMGYQLDPLIISEK